MKKFVPTTLSSSNEPQPSLACWWPSLPSAASSAAYSASVSPFMIRCCQSMLTSRPDVSTPRSRTFWITCSVMPMLRISTFIAGSLFLCSR